MKNQYLHFLDSQYLAHHSGNQTFNTDAKIKEDIFFLYFYTVNSALVPVTATASRSGDLRATPGKTYQNWGPVPKNQKPKFIIGITDAHNLFGKNLSEVIERMDLYGEHLEGMLRGMDLSTPQTKP